MVVNAGLKKELLIEFLTLNPGRSAEEKYNWSVETKQLPVYAKDYSAFTEKTFHKALMLCWKGFRSNWVQKIKIFIAGYDFYSVIWELILVQ